MQPDEAAARRVLGVSPAAGPDEIRHAYRARAREHHPDRHGADAPDVRARHAAAFAEANAAWLMLREGHRPGSRGAPFAAPDVTDLDVGEGDLDDDLDDDEALSDARPGCVAIGLPIALFVIAVLAFAVASLFESRVLWQASLAIGALAAVAFMLAPFFTMLRARR